jgi:hypothetical protein
MSDAPKFKTAADDGEARTHRSLTNQKRAGGENHPTFPSGSLACRGERGFATASRPPTARCGRHEATMYETYPTDEDSRRTTQGCHGCHAPVTPRGVTPYGPPQAFYLPAGGGVTGVTAESQLIARTQARVRAPALACITRISAVTAVTPPLNGSVTPQPRRKGVTPPGVTPRDPAVTPRGWSA